MSSLNKRLTSPNSDAKYRTRTVLRLAAVGLGVTGLVLLLFGFLGRGAAGAPSLPLGGLLPRLLVEIGASLLMWIGFSCYLLARKLAAKHLTDVTVTDSRAPVVYLRSFAADAVTAKTPRMWPFTLFTEEEQLAEVLADFGPVIAIGRPHEKLPGLGAHRLYVEGAQWQDAVAQMVAEAQLVVIRAGETPGLQWEVQKAGQITRPDRLLFLIPSGREEYEAFRTEVQLCFPYSFPDYPTARKVAVRRRGATERFQPSRLNQFFAKVQLRHRTQFLSRQCASFLLSLSVLGSGHSLKGIVYFDPDGKGHFLQLGLHSWESELGGSLRKPLVPNLRKTLRPVYQQLGVIWHPLPVNWSMFLTVVFGVLLGILLGVFAISQARQDQRAVESFFSSEVEVAIVIAPELSDTLTELGLQEVQKSTVQGIERLDDKMMVSYINALEGLLAVADSSECAGAVRGTIFPRDMSQLQARLDSTARAALVRPMATALVAEIKKDPRPRSISRAESVEAMTVALSYLSKDEAKRFTTILETQSQLNDDICWAAHTLCRVTRLAKQPYQGTIAFLAATYIAPPLP